MLVGTKFKNKHTGESLTFTGIEVVQYWGGDLFIHLFDDGSRWLYKEFMQHHNRLDENENTRTPN